MRVSDWLSGALHHSISNRTLYTHTYHLGRRVYFDTEDNRQNEHA
jgi:hypothetical protein